MVDTTLNDTPLDPTTTMHLSNASNVNNQQGLKGRKLSEIEMMFDRNVAPSPKAMCAELAHEHALEDLHKITDHTSEENPVRGPVYSENYLDQTTQTEPRKPED